MPSSRKTCLVTGCSAGGVGPALAQAFVDKGYHVFATARTPSKVPTSLHDTKNVTILTLDVTSTASITAAADAVRKQTEGKLDVLINNAGVGMAMPMLDASIAESKAMFDLNVFSAMEMNQVFMPMLVKAQGCVVNHASVGALCVLPFNGIYSASKAAMVLMGEALRIEVAPLGVRVLTLLTGGVDTKFIGNMPEVALPEGSYYQSVKDSVGWASDKVPMADKPEAIAGSVVKMVDRGNTGKVWVGGGSTVGRCLYWIMPQWLLDRFMLSLKPPFYKQLEEERKKYI